MSRLFDYEKEVEARWINPENPDGAKGAGGTTNGGRKGKPCYGDIAAGETLVIADYQQGSGVIRHIWSTMGNRSPKMLRGLRLSWNRGQRRLSLLCHWFYII